MLYHCKDKVFVMSELSMPLSDAKKFSMAGVVNAGVYFLKSHVVCHGLMPLAELTMGKTFASTLETPVAQTALDVITPPLVALGTMAFDKTFPHKESNGQSEKKPFWQSFKELTLLYYTIGYLGHLAWPHAAPHIERAAEKTLPKDMFEWIYHEHDHHEATQAHLKI